MYIEVFLFLITAICLSGGRVYSDLLSLLDTFIKWDRLHDALDLYTKLMHKFPQVSGLFFLYKFIILYLFPYIILYILTDYVDPKIIKDVNPSYNSFYACLAR